MTNTSVPKQAFTKYQIFIIAILALLQFTIILDFMVISPLGAILLHQLNITPSQFGLVVSAYAFSAGISGLLAAGFADKFDRKKLLLFFYSGFVLGTLFCGLAPNFHMLLLARIVTGLFGGVVGSISMAIITDIFAMNLRGRVMGFVQMAFAASQVLGIPFGIYLATKLGWHSPFILIVILSGSILLVIAKWMQPVNKHLAIKQEVNAIKHLSKTVSNKNYILPFITTALLSMGGFLLMPFSSAFLVNNVKIEQDDLTFIYMITGICAIVTMPLIGKLTDKVGKFNMFTAGTVLAIIMVVIYTNLSVEPLWVVVVINAIMFAGIMSRMIPSQALMTAIPQMQDRGAFMSVNSSLQQIAGGIASVVAGLIVIQQTNGPLLHYNTLGYIGAGFMVICLVLMYFINKNVQQKVQSSASAPQTFSEKPTLAEEVLS
jgi:predicted MFS family arabinose efflux permease